MKKNIWNLKSGIYQYRDRSVFGKILASENRALENLLQKVPFSGGFVLDLGAGLGNAAAFVKKGDVISMDYSIKMLKKNRAVSPVKYCIAGNAMNIPLQTASLDILLAVGLLEYVKDKARALKEIDRVLKPGSFAVLTFSPKNFYTILRLIWGNRIYATTDSENEALLSKKFEITAQEKTLMQRQYLIKKP